ncbi:hypothetical protein HMI56_004049 [Coelomomyces lativittatus]|nr:hypothetical protein HMI56_004049 [Coelomomyces lativittatus]
MCIFDDVYRSLRSMPLIFLFPIMKYIILVLIFAYFTYVFALLATSGTVISESTVDTLTKTANNAPFTKIFTPNRVLPFFQIYIVLGFFWTWNFIMGVWQTTIAGAVASWFWTKDKHQLASSPVQRSFGRCFRYHLGSIALGSFIIAIVQTLRVLLLYIQKNMKKMPNHQTVNYILACIQCCFALIERIIALINTNAYIEIAVYGYGFCEGAKKAFDLLVRNAYRLIVVEGVGGFLLFLGKLLIVSVTCIVGMVLLFHFQPELGNFNAVPLIFIFVLAWFIASLFVAVMDMAIDTIFLCFCEDSERNDGSLQKPYFMSKELKEFTDKHKCDAPKF